MKTLGQLKNVKVEALMTRQMVTVMADDSVKDLAGTLLEHGLSTIPVVNSHGKCIGIISRKDLTELFLQEDVELSRLLETDRLSLEWFNQLAETTEQRSVKELMTDNVSVINTQARLADVCREMVRNRVHHLPVVDDSDKVVGIVSSFDIVDAIANTNDED